MKQHEVLRRASLFLKSHNCEAQVAEILLQHHLKVSRAQFFMNMHTVVPEDIITRFQADIARHVETGIPVQHITGQADFYGRTFSVNEQTLIPRPETEELVEYVRDDLNRRLPTSPPVIVDVGTGTGIIAITLKLEYPDAQIYATDISDQALQMARKNAADLGADITFLHGDFLKPIIARKLQPDIIISNPPYIAAEEKAYLSRTVKEFDPQLALFAADGGLAAYKQILRQMRDLTVANSQLIFEIGHEQGPAVKQLIREMYRSSQVEIIQDINRKDRIVVAHTLHD